MTIVDVLARTAPDASLFSKNLVCLVMDKRDIPMSERPWVNRGHVDHVMSSSATSTSFSKVLLAKTITQFVIGSVVPTA